MSERYGKAHRWFAWHPVWTDEHGWRWLQYVVRRRFWLDLTGQPAHSWWTYQYPET